MAKTTIQVDDDVLRQLDHLKREKAFKSYSDTLRDILRRSKTLSRSERGMLPRLKPFVREKTDRFD